MDAIVSHCDASSCDTTVSCITTNKGNDSASCWSSRVLMDSQLHRIGSADRGLYRVHQFSKVEMFVVSTPEQSEAILEELCQIEEEIFKELGLHYKVLV